MAVKTATEKLAAKGKTAVSEQEDLLQSVAIEVENLTESKAIELAKELVESAGSNDFRLGGVLAVIQDKGWKGEGYENFDELLEGEFKIQYRKAMYLIKNYKLLTEKQIPWETVKDIGWSKLRELAPILTPKNAEKWAKKAEKLTVVQVIDEVRKANAKGDDGADAEETSKVSTMTFKVHPDQKDVIRTALDKAKEETGTEFDTNALANICNGYNGGSVAASSGEASGVIEGEVWDGKGKINKAPTHVKKQVAQLVELFKAYGDKAVLEAFDQAFENILLEVEYKEEEEAEAA